MVSMPTDQIFCGHPVSCEVHTQSGIWKKKNIFSATLPFHIFDAQRAINELNTVLETGDSPFIYCGKITYYQRNYYCKFDVITII